MSSALPTDRRTSMHLPCTPSARKKDVSKLESSSGMRLQLYTVALVRVGALSPATFPRRSETTTYLPQRELTMGSPNKWRSYRREGKGKEKAVLREGKTAKRERDVRCHIFTFNPTANVYEQRIANRFTHLYLCTVHSSGGKGIPFERPTSPDRELTNSPNKRRSKPSQGRKRKSKSRVQGRRKTAKRRERFQSS